MAQCLRFVCTHCGKTIDNWDDGNPFYLDPQGNKVYAYHPDEDRYKCIGNDSPHLCLSCGEEFNVDSRFPSNLCPKCGTENITSTGLVEGETCPSCKQGTFQRDKDYWCIS